MRDFCLGHYLEGMKSQVAFILGQDLYIFPIKECKASNDSDSSADMVSYEYHNNTNI